MITGGFKNMSADKIIQCILAAMLKLEQSTAQNFARFKIKLEDSFDYTAAQSLVGEDQIIPLSADGKASIVLQNNGLISLNGVNYDNIINNSTAEIPHPGKPYFVFNGTDNPVTLNHNIGTPSNNYKPFWFYNGESMILPPGGMAEFKFNDANNTFDKVPGGAIVINDLTTGGASDALSAEMGVFLKSLIDSIYQPNTLISSVPPTRSGNTFTYPANQYKALINKTIRTNSTSFVTTINVAATDYKRVDLIWFRDDNTLVKTVGVESITAAQRPDIPVGQVGVPVSFINVYGNIVEEPTPITAISILNGIGQEQFKITDSISFENVSFNAGLKKITIDPVVALTAFVDTVNGNNLTAVLGNINKPFKSDVAAYAALPPNDGSTWTLQYIDGSVTRMMTNFPARPLIIKSNTKSGIFNFSGATGNNALSPYIELNFPDHDFVYNQTAIKTQFGGLAGSDTSVFILNCRNISLNMDMLTSFGFFTGSYTSAELSSINCLNFTISTISRPIGFSGLVKIRGSLNLPTTGNFTGNGAGIVTLDANVISHPGTGVYSIFGGGGDRGDVKIKSITGAGTIELVNNYQRVMSYDFTGLNVASTVVLSLGNSQIGTRAITNVTGVLNKNSSPLVVGNYKALSFSNFEGKIAPFNCQNLDLKMFNSTIYTDAHLISGTAISSIEMSGIVTIIQTNPSPLILNQATPYTINIYGDVKTNSSTWGRNIYQNIIAVTFKEEKEKVVIRDKIDLIGRVLDSQTTYVIDGLITFFAGEFVEVPAGGLTITGYGFDVSGLSKNVAGESIFTSPVGGSGNFITKEITFSPGAGSVFNLTDSNGSHAVEWNDVNFGGSSGSSVGIFNGYRQFTGAGIGFYGLSDGMTFGGTWSGFRLTNSNVIGFGASGTLFKKGVSTVFTNRFYTDLNAQFATGSVFMNFDETNFSNKKSLHVVNTYIKVNGVLADTTTTPSINLTTSTLFPNITPMSPKSYFVGNLGINNSKIEQEGEITFTLDGAQNVFDIPHTLGVVPNFLSLTFSDGGNVDFIQSMRTKDAAKIRISASNTPAVGSITVWWKVSYS